MNKENNVFYWLPCSVVFVSTAHGEQRDIMTATAMFVISIMFRVAPSSLLLVSSQRSGCTQSETSAHRFRYFCIATNFAAPLISLCPGRRAFRLRRVS